MVKNFIILLGLFFVLEFYVYQAIRTVTQNHWVRGLYIGVSLLAYAVIAYEMLNYNAANRSQIRIQWIISVFLIFILPKLLIFVFLLINDFFRFIQWGFRWAVHSNTHFPERRKFLSLVGVGLAGVLSMAVADGIIFGKYRHRARRVRLKLKNLPAAFKGYKIVQISDVHSGSFLHPEKLQSAIDLINEQQPDLVLFTGDMVNNYADEFQPFIPLFKQIKAKDGKFSVLGNHDYGDYGQWKSKEEKAQNIPRLITFQKEAGFEMLRNEHRIITKNGQNLYILGVENWGEKPFPQFGDLDKAVAGVPKEATKILMSHDPTHFDHIVKHHPKDIQLTLSGHTHGMQFGLDLKNVRWSPVQYRYKKWADLYESEDKYLYVNRGFGVLAYPGRVGINPEITVFELS
ncbi:metallophosphoesterase [Riemerella columbina]|uniref:metallophosphoesterase n=1 Tax=Riemerella columbina TaxID=103810 RepID=UPI0003656299|nr:metallophosphoesterase [Riemerella columbina]